MKQEPSMISLVEDYLMARRKMGFALDVAGEQLRAFARSADETGHRGPVTAALTVRWAQSSLRATPLTWARRLEVLRPFAKYRSQFDAATEIVPRAFFGPAHRRLVPHIYYEEEIVALLNATDKLLPVGGLRPLTYRTLFGLVAATGLRISEALHLKPQDVDLRDSILTVRQTKFRKSRLVPLHSTTTAALTRYAAARRRKLSGLGVAAFFVSDRGEPLADRTVHGTFEKLRADLGWVARGGHAAPRIHDMRHSFICNSLLRCYQQHQPIDNVIDALSTYVGHAKVSDTYWYITATPELMAVAVQRFSQFAEGVAR
jgi:integrase